MSAFYINNCNDYPKILYAFLYINNNYEMINIVLNDNNTYTINKDILKKYCTDANNIIKYINDAMNTDLFAEFLSSGQKEEDKILGVFAYEQIMSQLFEDIPHVNDLMTNYNKYLKNTYTNNLLELKDRVIKKINNDISISDKYKMYKNILPKEIFYVIKINKFEPIKYLKNIGVFISEEEAINCCNDDHQESLFYNKYENKDKDENPTGSNAFELINVSPTYDIKIIKNDNLTDDDIEDMYSNQVFTHLTSLYNIKKFAVNNDL